MNKKFILLFFLLIVAALLWIYRERGIRSDTPQASVSSKSPESTITSKIPAQELDKAAKQASIDDPRRSQMNSVAAECALPLLKIPPNADTEDILRAVVAAKNEKPREEIQFRIVRFKDPENSKNMSVRMDDTGNKWLVKLFELDQEDLPTLKWKQEYSKNDQNFQTIQNLFDTHSSNEKLEESVLLFSSGEKITVRRENEKIARVHYRMKNFELGCDLESTSCTCVPVH